MNKYKLYLLLFALCIAGYIWLGISFQNNNTNNNEIGVCLFKNLTNLPCPSCGSTRSIQSLFKGDFIDAMEINPLGIILLLSLIIIPLWLFYDLVKRKETFFNFYIRAEYSLQRKIIAVPAIILILINWIWNFYKGV
jgi:hypothetical protein